MDNTKRGITMRNKQHIGIDSYNKIFTVIMPAAFFKISQKNENILTIHHSATVRIKTH